MRRSGFTLIEIMIVIAIVGVLAAIAVPSFREARKRANQRACYANIKTIAGALIQYNLDKNTSYEEDPINFNFLTAEGYLQGPPDDPGAGGGSHGNYKVDTDPDSVGVLCSVHGRIGSGAGSTSPSPSP